MKFSEPRSGGSSRLFPESPRFKPGKKGRSGLSFVEILVAVTIVALIGVPLIGLVSSTRSDTSKAINYLRALELASEAMTWIKTSIPAGGAEGIAELNESLVQTSGKEMRPAAIQATSNLRWGNVLSQGLEYSEQYNGAFFYRTVKADPVNPDSGSDHAKMLKKVTVTIWWNEGKVPSHIETTGDNPERMRKIVLSSLIIDQKVPY